LAIFLLATFGSGFKKEICMNKFSWRKQFLTLMLSASLMTLVSCGSDNDDDNNKNTPQEEQPAPISLLEGNYEITFTALNSLVAGNVSGNGAIIIQGDEVIMRMNLNGAPAFVEHEQHIYLGSTCPTNSQDANNDGFLDASEASAITGKVLIPLDADLDSQESGMNTYPRANSAGNYRWVERTSLSLLVSDLRAPDTNTEDEVAKLAPNEELRLEGRVVKVHGISPMVEVPNTVKPSNDRHAKLPIACGVIRRVSDEGNGSTTDVTNQ
jgi:hypothetical protein